MERIAIVSIVTALLVPLSATRARADGDYEKICRVSENVRVLANGDDANSCRKIAIDSQAPGFQIGCRDSENNDIVVVTAPFHALEKAARVTGKTLAANTQNTATQEQFAKCAKAWGNR